MTEQQQKLYDKLLKKVNEYCLGAAAEDVIAAIDDLVDSYESRLAEADGYVTRYEEALDIFKRNCLLSQYPDGSYELAFTNKIQPRDEDVELLKEILK